ncbi:MAG: hypothetical protein ACODAD_10835 [Planctomycetota bacterium]
MTIRQSAAGPQVVNKELTYDIAYELQELPDEAPLSAPEDHLSPIEDVVQEAPPSAPEVRLSYIEYELRKRRDLDAINKFTIGQLYWQAKQLLPHGQFEKWADGIDLYGRTARTEAMRIYEYCAGRPELAEKFAPTILTEMCRPRFPAEFRESLLNAGGFVGTQKQLLHAAERISRGEWTVDSPQVKRLHRDLDRQVIQEHADQVWDDLEKRMKNAEKQLKKLAGRGGPTGRQTVRERLKVIRQLRDWIEDDEGIYVNREEAEDSARQAARAARREEDALALLDKI